MKTVKSFLAAAIATAAALVSTVASAYDDGVLSTPDDTVVRKGLGGGGAGAVPEGWIFSHEKNG